MNRYIPCVIGMLLAAASAAGSAAPENAVPAESRRQIQWRPSDGATEIALWPKDLPIARPELTSEEHAIVYEGPKAPAGRSVTSIRNVARPTMTVFPAKGVKNGAAVLVFPGGGYQILAIDFEGTEVCDWLTAKGITCVVLKYRVPQTWWPGDGKGQRAPAVQMALQDAERAMVLLRHRAREFGIDPRKIGVLGFSAGGHLVAQISNADAPNYAPVDVADEESTRPDFGVALYSGHIWAGKDMELYPFTPISTKAPPTFIIHAQDDPVDDVRHSIAYFLALREAKVPVEMHIYAHGGHAFGLRPSSEPISHWPELVETWLHTIDIL